MSQSPKNVPPERIAELSEGRSESRFLAEWLTIDVRLLIRTALPELGLAELVPSVLAAVDAAPRPTVPAQTNAAGMAMANLASDDVWPAFLSHTSDAVRCLGTYVAVRGAGTWPELLNRLQAFADDPHYGVREYAWMALRPRIASDLPGALDALTVWCRSDRENLRRCAVEATRPRGVWCAHLAPLKAAPDQAWPLLKPLKDDPSLYVRKSVGNWMNDAAKTRPDWVRQRIVGWLAESPTAATRHIARLATRSL